MEAKGKIIAVCEAVGGTSERTGNSWMAQTYVIEVTSGDHGQYKRKIAFEVFGEDRIKQFNLTVGRDVKVFFDIEANEYEGKWYNRVRAYAVENATGSQQPYMPQYQQPPQQGYRQQGGYQQRPPQNGFYQPVQQGYQQRNGFYQPVQQVQQPFPPQTDPVTGEPLPF